MGRESEGPSRIRGGERVGMQLESDALDVEREIKRLSV